MQNFLLNVTDRKGTNLAYVENLYVSVLGRTSDAAGVNSWVALLDSGASRMAVAKGFWESVEHRAQEVMDYYNRYLLHSPDSDGEQHWNNLFLAGASEEQVMLGFLTSPSTSQPTGFRKPSLRPCTRTC
jgi:hypothetical protein